MSNYSIQVNWVGKDALLDTDPNKVMSGSDMNTEFTSVRTAINSKADLNGSASENFAVNALTASSATINGQSPALLGTAQTFTKAHNTASEAISMTANQTANLLNTNTFIVDITATGFTLDVSNQTAGAKGTFIIKNQGAYTLTLDTMFKVPGGTYTATSGAGKIDKLECTSDGTSMICSVASDIS